MEYILIAVVIFIGFLQMLVGFKLLHKEHLYYCEELGYTADLDSWKRYTSELGCTKTMKKELRLMDAAQFMHEVKWLFNLTLKEI